MSPQPDVTAHRAAVVRRDRGQGCGPGRATIRPWPQPVSHHGPVGATGLVSAPIVARPHPSRRDQGRHTSARAGLGRESTVPARRPADPHVRRGNPRWPSAWPRRNPATRPGPVLRPGRRTRVEPGGAADRPGSGRPRVHPCDLGPRCREDEGIGTGRAGDLAAHSLRRAPVPAWPAPPESPTLREGADGTSSAPGDLHGRTSDTRNRACPVGLASRPPARGAKQIRSRPATPVAAPRSAPPGVPRSRLTVSRQGEVDGTSSRGGPPRPCIGQERRARA